MGNSLRQWIAQSRRAMTRLKPLLRWVIAGGTLFFLIGTLHQHWSDVAELRVKPAGWMILTVAFGVTILAHLWSGWVWSWILQALNQPASGIWGIFVYLKTNIAKYLPGNVWHFYGRVIAAKNAGFSTGAATLSVLLEPLLMAAAALILALIGLNSHRIFQGLSLSIVLLGIHPRILNPLLKVVSRLKTTSSQTTQESEATNSEGRNGIHSPASDPASIAQARVPQLNCYPLLPLSGELVFVALRGSGFILTVLALSPITSEQIPALLSGFSLAWLLGLVVPGAPGGLGVFEATAIALLDTHLSSGVILGSVALYRLISTLAEAGGAGIAWLVYPGSGEPGSNQ